MKDKHLFSLSSIVPKSAVYRYKFKIINDTKLEEELKNPDSSTFKVLNESWVKYKEFLARLENLSVTKSDISMFKTKLKDLIKW